MSALLNSSSRSSARCRIADAAYVVVAVYLAAAHICMHRGVWRVFTSNWPLPRQPACRDGHRIGYAMSRMSCEHERPNKTGEEKDRKKQIKLRRNLVSGGHLANVHADSRVCMLRPYSCCNIDQQHVWYLIGGEGTCHLTEKSLSI
jgi:hypothetical protein